MAKHTIEIDIELDGIIKSEVHGILGSSCELESKWLESLGETLEHKPTKEAYKQKPIQINNKVNS